MTRPAVGDTSWFMPDADRQTLTLELPVRKPDVTAPVTELFLT